jgi:hypothetical protein
MFIVVIRQLRQSLRVQTPHEWCMYTGMSFDFAAFITSFFTRCDTLFVKITIASTCFSFEAMFTSDLL